MFTSSVGLTPSDGSGTQPPDNQKCLQILPNVPWEPTSSPVEWESLPWWTNPIHDFIYQIWQEFYKIDLFPPSFPLPLLFCLSLSPTFLSLSLLPSFTLFLSHSSPGVKLSNSSIVGNPVLFLFLFSGFFKLRIISSSTRLKMTHYHRVHILANKKIKTRSEWAFSF